MDNNINLSSQGVTALGELLNYAQGKVVELPPFNEDQPFFAKLRRPSMMVLAKTGKIPNTLLDSATSLFNGVNPTIAKNPGNKDSNQLGDMCNLLEVICEASLVEPSYQELKDNNIQLTDEQMIAIMNYAQKGVKGLESFR